MFESVPYAVLYYQNSANPIDITIPTVSVSLKRQGTGRIRSASIMLDAFNGQFITDAKSGTTPIIQKFDKFKIFFIDRNNKIRTAIVEQDQFLPQLTVAGKTLLPIELLGRERALRDIKLPAHFKFKDPKTALETLKDRYNAQRGTDQPAWSFVDPITLDSTNEAPDNIPNIYDFAEGISYYEAVMKIISRLNQPTTLGGSGTFWSVTFEDDETFAIGAIVMRIHEQGKTTGPIPVLESTDAEPFHKVTAQKNTPTGTQILVRGTPMTGTMPPDLHRYTSYIEAINNFPAWNSGSTYLNGMRVHVGNTIYQAIGAVSAGLNPPANPLYWKLVTAKTVIDSFIASDYPAYNSAFTYPTKIIVSYFDVAYISKQPVPVATPPGNPLYWDPVSINYSLWTNNKVTVTRNSCSNPDFDSPIPNWDATILYPFGFKVQVSGEIFKSLGGVPIGLPPVGNPLYWQDLGPVPAHVAFSYPAFPDGNLVIRDRLDPNTNDFRFYRDFAWVRAKNDADIIADPRMKQYLMGKNKDVFYKGFSVLVDASLGAVGGSFAGNDVFGRAFVNSIAQFDGEKWIVQRTPNVGDECAIWIEGKVYEFNVAIADVPGPFYGNQFATPTFSPRYRGPGTTLAWRDVSGVPGGNDCFHAPDSIELAQGLIASNINGQDYSQYVANSALKITYKYDAASAVYQAGKALLDKIFATVTKYIDEIGKGQINDEFNLSASEIALPLEEQWYNYGWWYALPFPYPFSTFNGIGEKVGDFYGGNDFTASEFAALDLQNANFSHSGLTGFNHAEASDLGGPFTGLKFWFQFDILIEGVRQLFQGDLPFTISIYDDLRNVWRADYTYRLLGDPQEILVPFSGFTVTRPSRTPFHINSLADIIELVAVPELEILSIFEEKRVRLITIQFGQSYDQFLRFMPVGIDRFIRTQLEAREVKFQGIIDGLCLTKQPFVSSGEVDDRVINPDIIEAPNVRNYLQLKSIALAERDLHELPFEQFTVVRHGDNSFELEQSIYLKNQDLINESDQPGVPNTRKLILMTDEIGFDEVQGFISTFTLAKRLGGP